MSEYNGHKDHATWNCSLWINNDEGLYRAAVNFMEERVRYQGSAWNAYQDFIEELKDIGVTETPDGTAFDSADHDEMDAMLADLVSELAE